MFQELKPKTKSTFTRLDKLHLWFRVVMIVVTPIAVGVLVYKKSMEVSINATLAVAGGIFSAIIMGVVVLLIDFGSLAWDKSTSWLAQQLRKYPSLRRAIIFPLLLVISIGSVMITVFYWPWDNFLRFLFFMYFAISLPAALFSMLRDEKIREATVLSGQVTPELIANKPQAAIEHAFTLFEDHLRKRVGVGPETFGDKLINLAYGANGKLIYGAVENENIGARNFIAGAYATFRNPRKHRVIKDDEQTTLAIINVVELLIKMVDESKDNN